MKKINTILFSILIINMVSCAQSTPIKQIKWNRLHTEKEVIVELEKHISIGSSETELESFLKSQKLERYGKIENYYFAYARTKSRSFWIAKEWFIKFLFNTENKLTSIEIEAALTGP